MKNGIKIIVGHYGSGKTEFSVNYSISLAKAGKRVMLADLDIANPFFRSREQEALLSRYGISLISNSLEHGQDSDIPALSSRLFSLFGESSSERILDVGGNSEGARVLSRFKPHITSQLYKMWMVVNANRPETQTVQQITGFVEKIESSSRLSITGLINNTHMIRETTMKDVYKGNDLCREASKKTGIPIVFTCIPEEMLGQPTDGLEGEMMPMKIYLRPNWL